MSQAEIKNIDKNNICFSCNQDVSEVLDKLQLELSATQEKLHNHVDQSIQLERSSYLLDKVT